MAVAAADVAGDWVATGGPNGVRKITVQGQMCAFAWKQEGGGFGVSHVTFPTQGIVLAREGIMLQATAFAVNEGVVGMRWADGEQWGRVRQGSAGRAFAGVVSEVPSV
eukprot:gene7138-1605_t